MFLIWCSQNNRANVKRLYTLHWLIALILCSSFGVNESLGFERRAADGLEQAALRQLSHCSVCGGEMKLNGSLNYKQTRKKQQYPNLMGCAIQLKCLLIISMIMVWVMGNGFSGLLPFSCFVVGLPRAWGQGPWYTRL